MNDSDWLAARFEEHRPHLRTIAYRMLGSVSDTDDAVQEAWLRLSRADAAAVDNLGGWLTTVVGRVCLDMLRARNSRREDYVGSWLPEPVVTIDDSASPEDEALIADSVGLALLVVLETLTPAERLSFVLHDMFAVPFDEIAAIIGRSPDAARQLASRGRRRVRGAPLNEDADLNEQRRLVSAFLAASRAGDFEALIAVLDPDVVFRADTGAVSARARPPIEGAQAVARRVLEQGRQLAHLARPALVNGGAGFDVGRPGRTIAVVSFTVAYGRIVAIDLITDRDKLRRLARVD
ncbi:MAG: RNA polymerase sigma factor SigJ [Thermoleophilia bacterium]|nr:RNA polymerase sigma factor SigJ [Thermoleophilia bacterium]